MQTLNIFMQKFGIIKNAMIKGQLDSWKDIYKKGHKDLMINDDP